MPTKQGGLRGSLRNVSTGVSAIPDSVVDDFEEYLYEDQGLNLSDRYDGDVGAFSRQTATVLEGSYSLEYSSSSTSVILTDDFDVAAGTTYRCDIQVTEDSGSGAYAIFGNPDTATFSGYMLGVSPASDTLNMYRVDSGSFTLLDDATSSSNISADTRYIMEFQWGGNNELISRLLDNSESELAATTSVSDSTYTSGHIGWRFYNQDGTSTSGYFDAMREL